MRERVDANQNGKMIKKFWNTCIGAGRAAEGLRADWQKQLNTAVQECGFRYIRFHGLLCDEMGLYRKKGEKEFYNYAYIDKLFDALLDMGIRPFVELGFMPEDMASGSSTQFWWKGNVTPPLDYEAWGRMLSNLVSHWIGRYGLTEVKQWYFEIWNEPNLHSFWDGTKAQYFELYQVSVRAIKGVCVELRVGGPATSNFVPDERFDDEVENFQTHKTHLVENLQILDWKGVWIEDFLSFCEKRKLPLDFISSHPYPTDFALDGQDCVKKVRGRSRHVDSTKEDLLWLKGIVKASAYKNAEIHLTEWSSSPSSRDCSHDYLPVAAYIVKCNLDSVGLTDSLSYWVFTDIFEELGPGPEAFHGGFGLLNMHGIKKPAYHAYRFLNRLGNEMILKTENYIITRDQNGKIRGLFYHYPNEISSSIPISEYPNRQVSRDVEQSGSSMEIILDIENMEVGTRFVKEILSKGSGNIMKLWEAYGCPANLSREQESNLKECADALETAILEVNEVGVLELRMILEPWSVVFIAEQ